MTIRPSIGFSPMKDFVVCCTVQTGRSAIIRSFPPVIVGRDSAYFVFSKAGTPICPSTSFMAEDGTISKTVDGDGQRSNAPFGSLALENRREVTYVLDYTFPKSPEPSPSK